MSTKLIVILAIALPARDRRTLRRPIRTLFTCDHHHQGGSRGRRRLHASQSQRRSTGSIPRTARLLPRRRDHPPHLRFRNQD
jgi:hypothetical protein